MVWDFTGEPFIHKLRIYFNTALFCLFLSSFGISAQQAELTVNVFNPLNNPASGLISVSGPDTSVEKELVNGTALFLLDGITALEDIDREDMNHLYPNPAGADGKVVLVIPSFDGKIEVFSIFGRKIFEGSAGDMEMTFPLDRGMGIILYTSAEGERAAFKVLNPASDILSLTIKKQEPSQVKNTMAVDGYHIVYIDPWQDLEETSSTRIIYPGSFFTENFRPAYSMKTATVLGKTSGISLILIKNPSDEIIGFYETGTDGVINPFSVTDAFSKSTGEDVSAEISGYNADTLIFAGHINQGDTILINQLLSRHYCIKVNCTTQGFSFTVSDKDGFLGSGNSQSSFKKESDSLYVDITGSASGYKTSRLYDVLIKPGVSWCTMSLTLADTIFQHLFTVNLSSSEAAEGHSILNPYVDITTSIGTNRKTFTGGTVAYAWDSDVKNEMVTYDIGLQGTGHKDLPATSLAIGITPVVVTRVAEANDFTGNITFNVKDSQTGLNLNGAAITTSQSKTGTTNTSGNATLTGYLIDENAYSEPVSTAVGYSISKIGYVTTIGAIAITGGDITLNATLTPVPTYAHTLKVNLISDETGHFVKDSTITFTTALGTSTLITSGQTVTYAWSSAQENDSVIYDINVSAIGHTDVGAKKVIVGTALVTENITLVGKDFTGNITFNVKDSITHANVSGAEITTSQGKTGLTDLVGNITLSGYTIAENIYSEAISTSIGYAIKHTGYYTWNDSVKINAGNTILNSTIASIGSRKYLHSLKVNLISNEAGQGHVVKDSTITFTTAVDTSTWMTSGQTVTYAWISTRETDSVLYDIHVSTIGHTDVGAKKVIVGTALVTENITLLAKDFTGNIIFNVKDSITHANVDSAKITTSQSKTGVTDTIGNVTFTGYVIGENKFSEPTDTAVAYTITHAGYYAAIDTVKVRAGNNIVNDTLAPVGSRLYTHRLKVILLSDEAGLGHVVKDSTVSFTTNQGTTTLPTAGQNITYTFTSHTETDSVIYDINVSKIGHADVGPKKVIVGIALVTENITLAAKDFTGNITFNVKDSVTHVNVSGAGIATAQGKTGTTDASGNLTFIGYVIAENTFSEPVSTSIPYTISKTGYTLKNGTASIHEGDNAVNDTIAPVVMTYAHSLTINLISDEAGEGHKVKDSPISFTTSLGTVVHSTSVQTYTYAWSSAVEAESVTYDIAVSGPGHADPIAADIPVGTTAVIKNVTLTAYDFTGNIAFHVTSGGSGINGAAITTVPTKSGTTDSNGDAVISDFIINENTYSEPQSTPIIYTITATGYTTINKSVNITFGSNNVSEIMVVE